MRQTGILRAEAHAKINWCLDVTGRTDNGYHLLDMLMQRVALYDTLFAVPSDEIRLDVIGQAVSGAPDDNLVLRAARALSAYAPGKGARITLVKRIPQGAGMGGGSSDAAAALRLLRRLWNVRIDDRDLAEIALKLGADVPFFLKGVPARVRGIGERLDPVPLPAGIPLVLVKLTEGLNTGKVFSLSDTLPVEPVDVDALLACLSREDWRGASACTGNALYPAAVRLQPALETAKRALEASGAQYVLMTGSGAVVYGVYASNAEAFRAVRTLKRGFPGAFIARTETVS